MGEIGKEVRAPVPGSDGEKEALVSEKDAELQALTAEIGRIIKDNRKFLDRVMEEDFEPEDGEDEQGPEEGEEE